MPAQTVNAGLTADPTLQWVWLTFSVLNTLNAHSKIMTSVKEKPLFEIGLVWKCTCKSIWFLFRRPKSSQLNIRCLAGVGFGCPLGRAVYQKCQKAYLGLGSIPATTSVLPHSLFESHWRSWGWRAGSQKDLRLISVFIWGLLNRVLAKKTTFSM